MAEILNGTAAASALTQRLRQETDELRARGVVPCIALLRAGDAEADVMYERMVERRCASAGIAVRHCTFPATVTTAELIDEIVLLNADAGVHGVLLFRPLPGHIDDEAVRRALRPEKDVDGVSDLSLAAICTGSGAGYPPCTAAACVELLHHYGVALSGKRAVVIGRSLVIGKPVALMLLSEDATVTVCHSKTRELDAVCREADIIITAAGKAGLIGARHVRPGQVLLDVGVSVDAQGCVLGDVELDEAEPVVAAMSLPKGGIGPVTTAVLARHVVEAAKKTVKDEE